MLKIASRHFFVDTQYHVHVRWFVELGATCLSLDGRIGKSLFFHAGWILKCLNDWSSIHWPLQERADCRCWLPRCVGTANCGAACFFFHFLLRVRKYNFFLSKWDHFLYISTVIDRARAGGGGWSEKGWGYVFQWKSTSLAEIVRSIRAREKKKGRIGIKTKEGRKLKRAMRQVTVHGGGNCGGQWPPHESERDGIRRYHGDDS